MSVPLAMIGRGKRVGIKQIVSGQGLRNRLSAMGIYEGIKVEVIKNDFFGPMIVKVLDSKVIIGRGQVCKITVDVL